MYDTADLFLWLLVTFRASGLFMSLPVFGTHSVPRVIRVAMAAVLAWIVAPLMAPALAYPHGLFELLLLVLKEVSIGVMMGLAVRLIFFTLDFAAHVLSVEIGLHPSPEFDPISNVSGGPLNNGLYYLAIVVFLGGAHYAVVYAFARSLELVPPGLQSPDTAFVSLVVDQTTNLFRLGVMMAAPVLAVNFLVNLVFSILGRVVPRMNVFILSFSVRIMAGLAMLAVSAGLMTHYLMQEFSAMPERMLQFLPFGHP
jgi:flagellar biosynthesis protein FliR